MPTDIIRAAALCAPESLRQAAVQAGIPLDAIDVRMLAASAYMPGPIMYLPDHELSNQLKETFSLLPRESSVDVATVLHQLLRSQSTVVAEAIEVARTC